jgi:choline dehydrogenase
VTYTRHNVTRYVAANKEIIVSAGTYESPKLLMLSGIGPTQHLASHGVSFIPMCTIIN